MLYQTKDKVSGVYRYDDTLVIKSYFKTRVNRFVNNFFKHHRVEDFEIIFHSYTRKGYRDNYMFLAKRESEKQDTNT